MYEKTEEQEIIIAIQNYSYNKARFDELQEQIESICYKTTPAYGNLAASSGGGFNSKVEDMGIRRYELTKKADIYKKEYVKVENMIENSGLDEREKKLMWWIARNGRLAAFARREHIGKDNVYKIRDRAVKKIIAATKAQNGGK